MSRPIGSKNKTFDKPIVQVYPNPQHFIKPVHYDLTMSLRVYRRHEKWPGQWELSKVDNDGKRTIIVDATSRQSAINMMNRQVMKMVIAG